MKKNVEKQIENQGKKSISHLVWFFLIPSIAFLGWAGYSLVNGLNKKQETISLVKTLEKIEGARSAGARWQSAYSFSQELQKKIITGDFDDVSPENKEQIFQKISLLINKFKNDGRLKRYLLLTLGQLNDFRSLKIFDENLNDPDEDISFFSSWGYLETLSHNKKLVTQKHLEKVSSWLKHEKENIRKIASTFLVQYNDPKYINKVAELLNDEKKEVRWNASVALASIGDLRSKKLLKEMFNIDSLRNAEIRSAKDLEQLVASAYDAAKKLKDKDIIDLAHNLAKSVNLKTPEGKAIARAIKIKDN